jgi:hypothetical protein
MVLISVVVAVHISGCDAILFLVVAVLVSGCICPCFWLLQYASLVVTVLIAGVVVALF